MNKSQKDKSQKNKWFNVLAELKKDETIRKYKGYTYGIGIEHEMYFFHLNPEQKNIKSLILAPTEGYQYLIVKKYPSNKNSKFIGKVPYEPTGRICNGKVVLEPLPGTWTKKERMPEFITDKPINIIGEKVRTFKYYTDKIISDEGDYQGYIKTFLNKIIPGKIDKYGEIRPYPFGNSHYIKLPSNFKTKDYRFRKGLYHDYTGSYHVTMTLPYKKDIKLSKFVEKHERFANLVQWLEPLLVVGFFSSDDTAMGTTKKKIKGSYRVVRIGWGNFAGSDIRKLKDGIGRYADIKPYWREGLDFYEKDKSMYCEELAPKIKEKERGAKYGFSSDFRTFGSTDPDRPDDRESGAPMTVGNGVEIRIFDQFPTSQLSYLCKILSLAAEASRNSKEDIYVYQDKDWIKSLQNIMINGYLGDVTDGYIKKLEKLFRIKFKTPSRKAYKIFEILYEELCEKYSQGDYYRILNGIDYHGLEQRKNKRLYIPNVNRKSWEFGLTLKLNNNDKLYDNFKKMLNDLEDETTYDEFRSTFFKYLKREDWVHCLDHTIYYLETLDIIKIIKDEKDNIIYIYKTSHKLTKDRLFLYYQQIMWWAEGST